MKKPIHLLPATLAILALLFPACGKPAPEAGAKDPAAAAEAPAGTVVLTEAAVAGGGIAVEPARIIQAARRIRVLGDLEFDARRVAAVPARVAGRLERVTAYQGDRVAAGQVLAEIYSQDFLALQAELLQAARRAERLGGDPDEPAARALLGAARQKLLFVGLSGPEIEAVVAARTVRPLLPVRAPIAGTVMESAAVSGASVAADAGLFKLGDASTLWGCVHLTETDLAGVRPGMAATVRTQAYPGREFSGRLILVAASMDASTRTVEGRIEIPNPDGALKPGMYVEAWLTSPERRPVLTVPASAVQEFSSGRIVFVRTGPTTFAVRPVEAGEILEGRIEIRAGLTEGEAVVTAGGFLLKSELMKSSLGD